MDNLKTEKLQLSPPWVTYCRTLDALFLEDPGIRVILDQEEMRLDVYVEEQAKAEAISNLLPETKEFGGATLDIVVIPGNKPGTRLEEDLLTAFSENPVLDDVHKVISPLGTFVYVIWSPVIIQFFNDNLGDVNGNATMLAEHAAREVFPPRPGVYYCTAQLDGEPELKWP